MKVVVNIPLELEGEVIDLEGEQKYPKYSNIKEIAHMYLK